MTKNPVNRNTQTEAAPLTSSAVARALGISVSTVHNMVERGEIPATKLDGPRGAYLFRRDDVEAAAAKQRAALAAKLDAMRAGGAA